MKETIIALPSSNKNPEHSAHLNIHEVKQNQDLNSPHNPHNPSANSSSSNNNPANPETHVNEADEDADEDDSSRPVFDVELLRLLDLYMCPICRCVMRDAAVTPCGHLFCAGCLKTATQQAPSPSGGTSGKSECPMDRIPLKQKDIKIATKERENIMNLYVKCPNNQKECSKELGITCGWVGQLKALDEHMKQDCEIIECPFMRYGCEVVKNSLSHTHTLSIYLSIYLSRRLSLLYIHTHIHTHA